VAVRGNVAGARARPANPGAAPAGLRSAAAHSRLAPSTSTAGSLERLSSTQAALARCGGLVRVDEQASGRSSPTSSASAGPRARVGSMVHDSAPPPCSVVTTSSSAAAGFTTSSRAGRPRPDDDDRAGRRRRRRSRVPLDLPVRSRGYRVRVVTRRRRRDPARRSLAHLVRSPAPTAPPPSVPGVVVCRRRIGPSAPELTPAPRARHASRGRRAVLKFTPRPLRHLTLARRGDRCSWRRALPRCAPVSRSLCAPTCPADATIARSPPLAWASHGRPWRSAPASMHSARETCCFDRIPTASSACCGCVPARLTPPETRQPPAPVRETALLPDRRRLGQTVAA